MTTLADVLAAHRYGDSFRKTPGGYHEVRCWCGTWVKPEDHAAHQIEAAAAAGLLVIPLPVMAPLGSPLTSVQEIWDAFVTPGQADDAPPQSTEMRALMAVLRAVHKGMTDAAEAVAK